jgi:hypothetical protein
MNLGVKSLTLRIAALVLKPRWDAGVDRFCRERKWRALLVPLSGRRAADVYRSLLENMGKVLVAGDADEAREHIRRIVGERIEVRPAGDRPGGGNK